MTDRHKSAWLLNWWLLQVPDSGLVVLHEALLSDIVSWLAMVLLFLLIPDYWFG